MLVTHPGIDCVGFVGSHTTAERIVRAAGLKRTLIEASGNGPVIVCADADLERAAKGAVFAGFFCAGQVCSASERVLVDRRVHDDLTTDYWEAHEPFGGASGTRTGRGRTGGRYTMLDMTDLRTVVLDFGSLGR